MGFPIMIRFTKNNLGRIMLESTVSASNGLLKEVEFKYDSGSDFTTLSNKSLRRLGYTKEYLEKCPYHTGQSSSAFDDKYKLQYIPNMTIKFGNREIAGCRLFFSQGTKLRDLFGSDILKYFNVSIDNDIDKYMGLLKLTKTSHQPELSEGETPIEIYSLEN